MGFCALETEDGKQEGEDRRFLPAAQPVSFSVKAGYKNGLYIKEEEPDLDSLQPPEGGDCPVFFTIPFSDSFAGLKGSFCLHLCTALLQMGSACILSVFSIKEMEKNVLPPEIGLCSAERKPGCTVKLYCRRNTRAK